jgi:hypothetical protein
MRTKDNVCRYLWATNVNECFETVRLLIGCCQRSVIVLGCEPGGTNGGHHRQKLLEGHLEIEKSPLAEDPAVIIQNLVRNHQRQAREARYDGKSARSLNPSDFRIGFSRTVSFASQRIGLSQRHYLRSGASSHQPTSWNSNLAECVPYY